MRCMKYMLRDLMRVAIPIAAAGSLASATTGCSTMGTTEFSAPGEYRRGEPHITNEESPMIGNFGYVRGLGFGTVEDFKWHEVYETPRETQRGLDRLDELRSGNYSN